MNENTPISNTMKDEIMKNILAGYPEYGVEVVKKEDIPEEDIKIYESKEFKDAHDNAMNIEQQQIDSEVEISVMDMLERDYSDAVRVKLASMVVTAIRNMSMDEIERIRNTEGDPFKYVSFRV